MNDVADSSGSAGVSVGRPAKYKRVWLRCFRGTSYFLVDASAGARSAQRASSAGAMVRPAKLSLARSPPPYIEVSARDRPHEPVQDLTVEHRLEPQ